MGELQSLERLVAQMLDETGLTDALGGSEEVMIGLRQIQAELMRVSVDVHVAKTREVSLAKAVRDFHNYPSLARIHSAVDDALRWSMPPAIADWARRIFRQPPPPILDDFRGHLVERASTDSNHILRLLCEWALFEGLYLTLSIVAYLDPDATFMLGMESEDFAEIAEQTVSKWLAASESMTEDIRPFDIMVAAAMDALGRYGDVLQKSMACVTEEYRATVERRAQLELKLAELDPVDAWLIRNDLAATLGESPLSIERLQQRHLDLLPEKNRNAIDQRKSRTRKKLIDGGIAAIRRKKPAMLDLIREYVELATQKPKRPVKSKAQRSRC
jgi:hypothetical protein